MSEPQEPESEVEELDQRKRRLLQALAQNRGIVSTACQNAGVPRRTFYNWIEHDADFKAACEDINESSVDFAESKLFERIDAGSERAICFFLRTRGRSRGYRESGDGSSDLMNDDPLAVAYRPGRLKSRDSRFF